MSEKSKSLPYEHLSSTKESGLQSLHRGIIDHLDAFKDTSQTSSKLFLVVEDQPELAERNCEFLKKVEAEAHCVIAENPDQAKERLKLETPDLIVLDLMFKDISGKHSGEWALDLLRYIFAEYPQLNILVYTSDPNLLQPLIKEAQSHQGGFVVADKQQLRKDFINKVSLIIENQGIKLIPASLTQELDSIKINERKIQILQLVCEEALTDEAIGKKLNISRESVQKCMREMRDVLGICDNKDEKNLRILMCNKARKKGLI
jgi:response regulator of citrate/malate metabolism